MKRGMGVIKRFFKVLEENRYYQWIFFATLLVVIACIYFVGNKVLVDRRIIRNAIKGEVIFDDQTIIDSIYVNDSRDKITTKFYTLDKEVTLAALVLYDEENEVKYLMKTLEQNVQREDSPYGVEMVEAEVVSKINDECSENKSYAIQVYFEYKDKKGMLYSRKIPTSKYLYNGKIYAYEPNKFVEPAIDDSYVREVLAEGKICFFDDKMGLWVYKHNDRMIIFVNELFGISDDSTKRFKLHLYALQRNLLPEDRQQYGFESMDFYFNEHEYLTNASEYRVAILDMNRDYIITRIGVGLYTTGSETKVLRDTSFVNWN